MLKEEKLPEDSKSPPLNPASSLNPDSRNPISIHTAVSGDFSQSVPGTSSSALVGTKSTKSGQYEVKVQTQKKSEGNLKTVILNQCVFFPQVFHAQKYPPRVHHIGEKVPKLRSSSPSCLCHCQDQATTNHSDPHGSIELSLGIWITSHVSHGDCLDSWFLLMVPL